MINEPEIDKQVKAYEYSFLIENMLRVSMHNVLVKKVGLAYFDENTFPEYEYKEITVHKKMDVVKLAKQIKGAERKYNIWLGYDYPHFWYLDFSVLISLLDVYWDKYFYGILKTPQKRTKDDILSRLKRVVPIRNAIAHHRYITNLDLRDLENLFIILKQSLHETYLHNFAEIALNSFENLVKTFVNLSEEIKDHICAGKFIEKSKTVDLKNIFSAILSITEDKKGLNKFEEIFAILVKYNKLPRKPGRGRDISIFRTKTDIERKISSLTKLLGDYI